MKPGNVFYKFCYCLARAFIGIFYWLKVTGRENIPAGAAIICANHSSMIDPFLLAFVCGINSNIHIISKAELFRIPVISTILEWLGMISVDRDTLDIKTIKKTLGYLKSNEKVVIFPEGTRSSEDNAVTPKIGAVKIAEHAKVAVVPAFIPRKKPVFRKVNVVVGEPYYIERPGAKRALEEYATLTNMLMDRIKSLDPAASTTAGVGN